MEVCSAWQQTKALERHLVVLGNAFVRTRVVVLQNFFRSLEEAHAHHHFSFHPEASFHLFLRIFTVFVSLHLTFPEPFRFIVALFALNLEQFFGSYDFIILVFVPIRQLWVLLCDQHDERLD